MGPLSGSRSNVLFFVIDDLRSETSIFGGSPGTPSPRMHTPNIDALAAKSLVLAKAYTQQAICAASRASFLTGRRPEHTRVWDLRTDFRDTAHYTTIPQWFKMQGYITIGMGKINHRWNLDLIKWNDYYWAPNFELYSSGSKGKTSLNEGRSWMAVD